VPDIINTLILGIIEGITEFLPISSTGHLLIAEQWLGARSDLFNIAIQAGAILAIVLIYWRRLLELFTRLDIAENRDYFAKLALATSITLAGGFIATRLGFELPETVLPIATALIVGGLAILGVERFVAGRPQVIAVTWQVAFWVGTSQILAGVFPGTSRSAATIFAAMLAGLTSRPAATEFAFLVGIPTMFAATAYELMKMHGSGGTEDWNALTIGFVSSGVVAFIAVKWLLRYVQTHRFTVFAWYRIALGLVLLALVVRGNLR
jgi:undecaprenyl-diphosphatase